MVASLPLVRESLENGFHGKVVVSFGCSPVSSPGKGLILAATSFYIQTCQHFTLEQGEDGVGVFAAVRW